MHEAIPRDLERECRVFCRYLLRQDPTTYVLAKYVDANVVLKQRLRRSAMDALLLRLAVRHPLLTRLSDTYSRLMIPGSALRAKLVLLLAILESSDGTARSFRRIESNPVGAWTALLVRGTAFLLVAVASLLLLGPAHALLRRRVAMEAGRRATIAALEKQ